MDNTLTRIEARIAPETKAMIQKAADIESCSLAEYLSKSAQAAAQLTIANHNVLKLSAEGSRAFADAILNPKEPNQKLKDAAARYKRKFGNA
ncbi:DUF1778 domain-containing protein [Chamaesiphon sp. OTE_20_metabat_361]|uniref:type II toxin-antitoxin system TacA family antitoxin n=1 Tax=Chamaesiphon sp. OTE_20_metabat_361 TaxID=2964689 RepID=UPI00286A3E71|nr:DUF1778 domain-containing protein [Chamaesiphon sp. OTE_20_metabat_361]